MRSRRFDSRMAWAWPRPHGEWRASMMGSPPPLCSTRPPRNQGSPAPSAASRERVVLHHGVVVHVGDGPALVGVQAQVREVADDDGLEVHHQVAAEGRVLQTGEQEDARRLDGTAGHDDELGVHRARGAVRPDELDAGGRAALCDDPAHVGLGHQLGPAGGHGPGAAAPPDRPWRGSGSRRTRSSRSCCRPAGRRRRCCWPPSAPRRDGARPSRPRRTTAPRRTSARRAASGRARTARRRRGWHPPDRPRRWPARPRRSTARARRSRAASRRRPRPPAARRWRRGGSPPPGSAAPCRRHGCRRPRPSWGWSSPRRRACARPRRRSAGTPAAR